MKIEDIKNTAKIAIPNNANSTKGTLLKPTMQRLIKTLNCLRKLVLLMVLILFKLSWFNFETPSFLRKASYFPFYALSSLSIVKFGDTRDGSVANLIKKSEGLVNFGISIACSDSK